MPPIHLSSPDNPRLKRVLRLRDSAERRESGLFVVEGRRAIEGMLECGLECVELLSVLSELPAAGLVPTATVDERVMKRLSSLAHAPGLLATFRIPAPAPIDRSAGGLVLAEVSDPGNVGTLLRCAGAFGFKQVVLCGGADPYGPKVVQAATGALGRVQLSSVSHPAELEGGAALCGLVVTHGVSPKALQAGPRWLIVGNEAHGLSADWLAACTERLTLPMPGGTESLNAAVAGAIALYALGPGRDA